MAQGSCPQSRAMRRMLRPLVPLVLCLGATAGAIGTAHAGSATDTNPVRALAAAAHTLGSTDPAAPDADLRAFDRMVGDAKVLGVGEATHGSAEFQNIKHRLLRHLVERRGFTTFAFEMHWSAGLRLDAWVRGGAGNLDTLMSDELQNGGALWNTHEMAAQFRWMREWNQRHPDRRPLRVVGNDVNYAGTVQFDAVTDYVARHYPALLPEFRRLYRESRPTAGVSDTMMQRRTLPLDTRRRMRDDVRSAYDLLERQRPGGNPKEYQLVLQHARSIAQVGTSQGFDFMGSEGAKAQLHRDESMAANTVWWQRYTGERVLLSAHNTHVGTEPDNPDLYPRVQGQFLRDELGSRYVAVGFTFGQGRFNAVDAQDPTSPFRPREVGPTAAGGNEETLEKVSTRDYYLDTRTAPRAARDWLGTRRATRSIGASWPDPHITNNIRLAQTYDVVVHLHRVTETHMR